MLVILYLTIMQNLVCSTGAVPSQITGWQKYVMPAAVALCAISTYSSYRAYQKFNAQMIETPKPFEKEEAELKARLLDAQQIEGSLTQDLKFVVKIADKAHEIGRDHSQDVERRSKYESSHIEHRTIPQVDKTIVPTRKKQIKELQELTDKVMDEQAKNALGLSVDQIKMHYETKKDTEGHGGRKINCDCACYEEYHENPNGSYSWSTEPCNVLFGHLEGINYTLKNYETGLQLQLNKARQDKEEERKKIVDVQYKKKQCNCVY